MAGLGNHYEVVLNNCTNFVQSLNADFIDDYEVMITYTAYASIPTGTLGCFLNVVLCGFLIQQLQAGTRSWRRFRLLLNLSITDVITSTYLIISGSIQLFHHLHYPKGREADVARAEIMEALKCVSALPPALNYQAMCFFQYLALRYPIKYSFIITERFCSGIILTQWLGIFALSSLFGVKVLMPTTKVRDSVSLGLELVQVVMYALVAMGAIVGYVAAFWTLMTRRKLSIDKRRRARYAFLPIVLVNFIIMAVFMIALFVVTALLYSSMKNIYEYKHWFITTSCRSPFDVQKLKGYFVHKTQHLLIVTCWMLRLAIDPALHLAFNQQLRSGNSNLGSHFGSIMESTRPQIDYISLANSPSITPRIERRQMLRYIRETDIHSDPILCRTLSKNIA